MTSYFGAEKQYCFDRLICPRDRLKVSLQGEVLRCRNGHDYRIVDGIPIMLPYETEDNDEHSDKSLALTAVPDTREQHTWQSNEPDVVAYDTTMDSFVRKSGLLALGEFWRPLVGNMKTYPIPKLTLPSTTGSLLLDLGCSWGRWCIAAGELGYFPVGIDPSFRAVQAARRVASRLNIPALFLVADARFIPFERDTFDVVFSYSVFQFFSRADLAIGLTEIARVLKPMSTATIQMANKWGLRSLYHQLRRPFRKNSAFYTRFYSPRELQLMFSNAIGLTNISAEGFLHCATHFRDRDVRHLPLLYRCAIRFSQYLCAASAHLPVKYFADSLYVSSTVAQTLPDADGCVV